MPNDNIIPMASARPNLLQVASMSFMELGALSSDYLEELQIQAEIAVNILSLVRHGVTRRAALKNQP